MKVLITGGGGFVGSHLCEAELKAKNQVIATDIVPPTKVAHLLDDRNFKYVRISIEDPKIESLIKEVDLVYHFAAIASVFVYCSNPRKVLDVNVKGTIRIIEFCHKYNKKIVFSSSSEIYGKSHQLPWKEEGLVSMDTPERTRWCYAASKVIGEHYLFAYKEEGLRMAICRFFNFYGPRLDQLDERGRVITCFLSKFLRNEPVHVYEPGDQTRCFTYIDDGIDGIIKVAHNPAAEGQAFNIGDDREITILNLAKLMKKIGRFQSPIKIVPGSTIYGNGYEDIFRRVPDNTKAKKILGWQPKTKLEDGLQITIDHFKKNWSA